MNRNKDFSHIRGFTLVEVVTVMVIIGILAIAAASKFSGTDGYESYNYRARLIAALRLTQQRAMQQTNSSDGYCHQIVIETNRYGIPDRTNCAVTSFPAGWQPDSTGERVDSRYSVTFSLFGKSLPAVINFDNMGKPGGDCVNGCIVVVTEPSKTVYVVIEPEGYIHSYDV